MNMTMNTQTPETSHMSFGAKLQNAREAIGMDRKDAAAQLRLSVTVIDMIEKNEFPDSLPPIFIRGYTRAYAKLLQVSDEIIQAGLEPIKPRKVNHEANLAMPVTQMEPRRKGGGAMKGITTAIVLTMLWLVGSWWHSHSTPTAVTALVADNLPAEVVETQTAAPANDYAQLNQANAGDDSTPAPVATLMPPSSPTNYTAATQHTAVLAQAANAISQATTAYAPPHRSAGTASIPAYKRALATNQTSEDN
jgi:cytoskeleton protein RodZ